MIRYPNNKFFNELDRKLQNVLNIVDRITTREIIATSGLRTTEHNAEVGGVPKSSHLKGLAIDLSCTTNQTRYDILKCAITAGINRIGIGKNHIHLDIDQDKTPEIIFFDGMYIPEIKEE